MACAAALGTDSTATPRLQWGSGTVATPPPLPTAVPAVTRMTRVPGTCHVGSSGGHARVVCQAAPAPVSAVSFAHSQVGREHVCPRADTRAHGSVWVLAGSTRSVGDTARCPQ